MFTMSAPCCTAHSMASIRSLVEPLPRSSSTLPLIRSTPGATPPYRPPDAAPEPAMMEATCVPWPCRSSAVSEAEKFPEATTLPARSGWAGPGPAVGGVGGGRVPRGAGPAGQVRMVGVDARVQAGDRDAAPVGTLPPGRRRADLAGAVGERRLDRTVQPDLAETVERAGRR